MGVKTDYKSLMKELFSLCLTSDNNNSPALWDYFGFNGTGIKLTFEIDSTIPDFREVYYSDKDNPKQIALLEDLFNTINDTYKYPLSFTYISKIGAFYIHGTYSNEKEYRFLVKTTTEEYKARTFVPIPFEDDVSYIVVPFQDSGLAEFKLKKVTKGPNCSADDFEMIKHIIREKYADNIEINEL